MKFLAGPYPVKKSFHGRHHDLVPARYIWGLFLHFAMYNSNVILCNSNLFLYIIKSMYFFGYMPYT